MPQVSSRKPSSQFRSALLRWFRRCPRELPWRGTRDPYQIWVSEIMLQQTTTAAVSRYYQRFLDCFPNVHALAGADLSEVHRLWEGLGYYRRATQMHTAAQIIVQKYGGVFPDDFQTVLALPGIGRYTAGAILSIAFDQRLAILEANTIRLHLRLLALRSDPNEAQTNRTLWNFAQEILPRKNIGEFNQALMDLGSRVCTPKTPACLSHDNKLDLFRDEKPYCPLIPFCETFRLNAQTEIPIPKKKSDTEETTEVAVLVRKRKKILILQYPQGVRWAGFWDFPRCRAESLDAPNIGESLEKLSGRKITLTAPIQPLLTLKHTVTRFKISLHFVLGKDTGPAKHTQNVYETHWVDFSQLHDLPFHSSGRKLVEFLQRHENQ